MWMSYGKGGPIVGETRFLIGREPGSDSRAFWGESVETHSGGAANRQCLWECIVLEMEAASAMARDAAGRGEVAREKL